MKTVGDLLKLSAEHLAKHHIPSARRAAEDLLAGILKVARIDLYMQFDRPLEDGEVSAFRESIKRRVKREPTAYILGSVPFLDCEISLSPDVLIPRQETEIMVSKAIAIIKKESYHGKNAWDMCTGSGAIGIALKKKLPDLNVFISDVCPNALDIAKENIRKNNVEILWSQGDLLEPLSGRKADYFFCNPPYIKEEDYRKLEVEVRDFEPRKALVSGESGLEFYEKLEKQLPNFLNFGAKLFFEIGFDQSEDVKKIFSLPHWKGKIVEKDWAGKDRFFFLERA